MNVAQGIDEVYAPTNAENEVPTEEIQDISPQSTGLSELERTISSRRRRRAEDGGEPEELEDTLEEEIEKPKKIQIPKDGIVIEMIEILNWLIVFSIFGVLARLGLNALEDYPGTPSTSLVWVQFVGCVIMGFLSEIKDLFILPNDRGTSLGIFIGLTTGFCGSFTTFSSWMKECFLLMANYPYESRPRGYSVLGLLDGVLVTLGLSLFGLRFGAHVGLFFRHTCPQFVWWTQYKSSESLVFYTRLASVVLGFGVWLGAVLMAIFIAKWRGNVLFALVFGPLGTLLRWYLSRIMNPLCKSFPLGTFTANIFATVVIGCLSIAQMHTNGVLVSCQVINGLENGFCGCLSTVSTFVLELSTLKPGHAWTYGLVSIVVGVIVMCLTLGVEHWRFETYFEC
ncbi:CrcB-like protein-domain-containing protein [Lipomyces oligophaga]|uniref:CrcB-like protein-domain-containing protein n=1 Tax=Lipomyces oligophaga TaxID=45792 RepID=UPI0034CFEA1C